MKKIFYAVLFFVFIVSLGCNSGGGSKSGNSSIIGTWKGVTQKYYWGQISSPDSTQIKDMQMISTTFTINSDKTFKLQALFFLLEGTWSTSGNQLALTFNFMGVDAVEDMTYKIDGNQLTTTEQNTEKDEDETWDWKDTVYTRQ